MFSPESLARIAARNNIAYEDARAHVNELHVHVSTKNDKIGSMLNVSTLPLVTCGNCKACARHCYAVGCTCYSPDAKRAWAENTAIAKHDLKRYFSEIQAAIRDSKKEVTFFRWHVSGEIWNYKYFRGMVETAKMFPNTHFYTYTKMHDLVNKHYREIPKNMHVMYSHWEGVEIDNPHNFPEFHTKLKNSTKDYSMYYECDGECQKCVKNHRGCVVGETSWILEHR